MRVTKKQDTKYLSRWKVVEVADNRSGVVAGGWNKWVERRKQNRMILNLRGGSGLSVSLCGAMIQE